MRQFLATLDCRGRAVWWHLYCCGHADIAGLARAAGLDNDMEALLTIRQGINPAAAAVLGEPAVEFVPCRVDQVTGEKVYYHWWLGRVFRSLAPVSRPLVDVYETGDELVVIVEPGHKVELCNPEVTCRNGIVMLRFDRSGSR